MLQRRRAVQELASLEVLGSAHSGKRVPRVAPGSVRKFFVCNYFLPLWGHVASMLEVTYLLTERGIFGSKNLQTTPILY